jgi:endonuclease/exonuclease/phosphatase family metal-dependent hydrolase
VHGDDRGLRTSEAEAILERVAAPTVLVGDFNAVRAADEVGEPAPPEVLRPVDRRTTELVVAAGFTDAYRALHDDRGWTYESWHPFVRLDYVFAQGVEVASCEIVRSDASDHFALVADVVDCG